MSLGEESIRAFIALKTPADWEEKLRALREELAARLGKAGKFRWVKPGQIHLTLRFFGQITPTQAAEAAAALKEAAGDAGPFDLEYAGLGCFPGISSPRVLWVGLEDSRGLLRQLHQRVRQLTEAIGKPPDDRAFKPHLTLARIEGFKRSETKNLERFIQEYHGLLSDPWLVRDILLLRSHLSPQGARYEPLAEEMLRAEAV